MGIERTLKFFNISETNAGTSPRPKPQPRPGDGKDETLIGATDS